MIYAKYLIFSVCIISFIYLPSSSQYTGGNTDGSACGTLMQTACPPPGSTNIFYGGDDDGSACGTLTQTICSTCIKPDTGPVYHIPN
jgi:hypothetical protein